MVFGAVLRRKEAEPVLSDSPRMLTAMSTHPQERLLTRIGGLLRQAESTDNEHEAEAFLAAAQRLATRSSIDLAVARAHAADRSRAPTAVRKMIEIGEPGRKGLRTYVQLFLVIAAANDVRCDIARNSTLLFAYGFDTDLATCEALYSSLLTQMVRAADTYVRSGEYRKEIVDRVAVVNHGGWREERSVRAPVAPVTARLNFQLAFAERVGQRLAAARAEVRVQALKEDSTYGASPGTALALRDKEVALRDFYTSTSQARGRWRGPRESLVHSDAARLAGDRAGRAARLDTARELARPRHELDAP